MGFYDTLMRLIYLIKRRTEIITIKENDSDEYNLMVNCFDIVKMVTENNFANSLYFLQWLDLLKSMLIKFNIPEKATFLLPILDQMLLLTKISVNFDDFFKDEEDVKTFKSLNNESLELLVIYA